MQTSGAGGSVDSMTVCSADGPANEMGVLGQLAGDLSACGEGVCSLYILDADIEGDCERLKGKLLNE